MFEIREEESLERYLASWESCMAGEPWYGSDIMFWYDPEEMQEDIRDEFGGENVFLVAYENGDSEPLGVLSAVMRGDTGRVLHWQPSVLPDWRAEGLGEALITAVSTDLSEATLLHREQSEDDEPAPRLFAAGFETCKP